MDKEEVLKSFYISSEQFDKIKELFETLEEAFRTFVNLFTDAWPSIKEALECIDFQEETIEEKLIWNVPLKIKMKSQVTDNKPKCVRARSCC